MHEVYSNKTKEFLLRNTKMINGARAALSGQLSRNLACRYHSDSSLLCYLQTVFHFDAKVVHVALQLGVLEKQLDRSNVLGTAHRMCSIPARSMPISFTQASTMPAHRLVPKWGES